jgi:hypothetical protein
MPMLALRKDRQRFRGTWELLETRLNKEYELHRDTVLFKLKPKPRRQRSKHENGRAEKNL